MAEVKESAQLRVMLYGLFAVFVAFLIFAVIKRKELMENDEMG